MAILRKLAKPIAGTTDRKPLLVEQLANSAHQQHLMVLIVAPVAAAFYGFELGEFLLPVAQHVRLDAAEFADFTDCEVAFCRDRRQLGLTFAAVRVVTALHRSSSPPSPSVFDWRET